MTDEELAERVAIRMGVYPADAERWWAIVGGRVGLCTSKKEITGLFRRCDRKEGHTGVHIFLPFYPGGKSFVWTDEDD